MAGVEKAEILEAEQENRGKLNLTMVFNGVRPRNDTLSAKKYDIPTANEVVYVGENGDVASSKLLSSNAN